MTDDLNPTRRGFLGGLLAIVAPAIVTSAGYRPGLWTPPALASGGIIHGSLYFGPAVLLNIGDVLNFHISGSANDELFSASLGVERSSGFVGTLFGKHARIETPEFRVELGDIKNRTVETWIGVTEPDGKVRCRSDTELRFRTGTITRKT